MLAVFAIAAVLGLWDHMWATTACAGPVNMIHKCDARGVEVRREAGLRPMDERMGVDGAPSR